MLKDFKFKEKYDFSDLVAIMKILRSPGGCPWDAEQTHHSIRENFLEETYEVLEAIDTENPVLLEEELGDVLLQVVFHARLSEEEGQFDINDVANGICQKLIVRHPHVFGDVEVENSAEVLKNWDDIKRRTKSQKTQSEAMAAIPATYPALMKAQKVQGKAAKAGFDWRDADGAFEKIGEESRELSEALKKNNAAEIEDELGDLLFSVVNTARFCGCDAETALSKSTAKFMRRYALTEKAAAEKGINMKEASLQTLDALWADAKKAEKN